MWERNTNPLPLVHAPTEDQTLQPRHVPWPGIEPQPFGFWDDATTNWATLARAESYILDELQVRWKNHTTWIWIVQRLYSCFPPALSAFLSDGGALGIRVEVWADWMCMEPTHTLVYWKDAGARSCISSISWMSSCEFHLHFLGIWTSGARMVLFMGGLFKTS